MCRREPSLCYALTSVGTPAQHVYGLRIAKSDWGYKSLGLATDIATKGQHCRVEVYLREYGWIACGPSRCPESNLGRAIPRRSSIKRYKSCRAPTANFVRFLGDEDWMCNTTTLMTAWTYPDQPVNYWCTSCLRRQRPLKAGSIRSIPMTSNMKSR